MHAAGGGLIINVASIAGVVSGADSSAYSASKAAVISLSEALAQEQCEHGIQVSVAMPGFFRTHLMDRARAPAATLELARKLIRASNLEADEVAREILGRAAGGRTYVVLPRQYRFLWRFKRFAPARFQRFMIRFRSQLEARARAAGGSGD
jgi:short-subunit dehydrogenase